jgi:hypothetical protein
LRRGYSSPRGGRDVLWGNVGKVLTGTLEEIFNKVKFKKIIPDAETKGEAMERANRILKDGKQFIAFEVIIKQ